MKYKKYIKPALTTFVVDSAIILMGESGTPAYGKGENIPTDPPSEEGGYDDDDLSRRHIFNNQFGQSDDKIF